MHSEELIWTEPGPDEPEEGTLANAEFEDDGGDGLPSGSRFGRYVVLSKLGAGGMGVVYAAYDPELDRRVALKLMHQQHGVSEVEAEQASRRLLAEAKAMAQLSHPNVITVHDVGTLSDRVFIAMEFVDGVPLSVWMREPGRDWPEILEVFMKAGRGLEAAHQAGLVHRDFKPDNVLVDGDGRVRVLDFGLARRFDGRESGDKRRDKEAGTPAYMSPEQHLAKDLDHRSDQFSFCVALYEALYGELPFSAKTRFELAMAVTDGRVAPAPKGATVPNWLRWALLRGLDPDPDGRWPDMGDLLASLTSDPYRRIRGIAKFAVPGLVLLAFAFALFQLAIDADEVDGGENDDGVAETPTTCSGGEDELAQVWNAERAKAVEQAFAAGKVQVAPELATQVAGDIQRWTDAWLVAQGEAVGTTTSAGTPAALELKRFGHFNGSITRNGTALGNVVSAEITYANNLDRIETIRSDGRIDGADPSIAALTGRIEVRFADQTLVTQAINGEACEMEFAYVLPSGESFTFTVHAVFLPRPRIEISGPQGVQATFDWQAARDSVVGRMCTATLVNDVETY